MHACVCTLPTGSAFRADRMHMQIDQHSTSVAHTCHSTFAVPVVCSACIDVYLSRAWTRSGKLAYIKGRQLLPGSARLRSHHHTTCVPRLWHCPSKAPCTPRQAGRRRGPYMPPPAPAPLNMITRRTLDALMKNLNCNAVSAVQITHHFVQRLVRAATRMGCSGWPPLLLLLLHGAGGHSQCACGGTVKGCGTCVHGSR